MKFPLFSLVVVIMLAAVSCSALGENSSGCPNPGTDQNLLTNEEEGYCLLYPAKAVALSPHLIAINPVGVGDKIGDASASIEMEEAAGRTASGVADKLIADAGPGFNITRTDTTIDGEKAVIIDGLPGPDPWRKVLVVHSDRLYTLTFMPWMQQEDLENLYNTVIQSLRFLS